MFVLGLKGTPYVTQFTEKRENWHVILEGLDLRQSTEFPNHAEMMTDGRKILLPIILPVPEEQVFGWQNEFRLIMDAMNNPVPANYLRAKLGIAGIFRYLLDRDRSLPHSSPAAQLKDLIDSDLHFEKSLRELSEACNYTPDHLRLLFFRQYQLTPYEYRAKKRIDAAMKLMAETDMLLKEIAWHLGFRNEAAFSASFKKLTGASPKKSMLKLRKTF